MSPDAKRVKTAYHTAMRALPPSDARPSLKRWARAHGRVGMASQVFAAWWRGKKRVARVHAPRIVRTTAPVAKKGEAQKKSGGKGK